MSECNAVDLLTEARALIADPQHWTKGTLARRVDDVPCGSPDQMAHSYCAAGACRRAATAQGEWVSPVQYLERAADATITSFNDHPTTTHEDILSVFDRAIALAQSEAQEA